MRFRHLLGFFRLRRGLELRLIKLAPLELPLAHEALVLDPLGIVIGTLAGILEIHKPLKGDNPGPLLVAVPGAEVEHFFKGPDLKASRDHVLLFPEIALVGFDLPEVDELSQLFEVPIGKDEDVVHGEDHPPLPPLLQKLGSLVDRPLPYLMVLQLALHYLWVHNFIFINFTSELISQPCPPLKPIHITHTQPPPITSRAIS